MTSNVVQGTYRGGGTSKCPWKAWNACTSNVVHGMHHEAMCQGIEHCGRESSPGARLHREVWNRRYMTEGRTELQKCITRMHTKEI